MFSSVHLRGDGWIKGQTLLEVVVAVVIMGVVVGALVIAVLTGLKNATLAQNQVQATKLAQETVEKIRGIRNRDGGVTFSYDCSGGTCTTTANFSGLWGVWMMDSSNNSPSCYYTGAAHPLGCYFTLGGNTLTQTSAPGNSQDLENGFKRQIFFEDEDSATANEYTKYKKITVRVLWTDSSGEHESKISTVLSEL